MGQGARPFTFEEGRVTIVLTTVFDVQELARTIEAVVTDAAFTPGRDVIFDVRGSDINPTLTDIKNMLATLNAVSSQFSGRWAVVVSDALRYGLARMASSLASPLGMKMTPFHSMSDAHKWLADQRAGVSSDDD